MTPERPNFLFVMTDQQRADWLGAAGHPVLETPHIDRLAAGGVRFERLHTASPVCMPNRASFMTGRYPSTHGLRFNGGALPTGAATFVDVLAAAGYRTAAIGKSHLQPFTDVEPLPSAPFEAGPIAEARRGDGADYALEEPGRYLEDGRYAFPTPYYGFQHVDMVTGHGDRCGGHYGQWLRRRTADWRALHDPANELPHSYACPQAFRTPVPEELYPTAYIRDRALDWLAGAANGDAPFFLFVSFPDPHHPFNPPGRYWDRYGPEQFERRLPYAAHRNPTPPMRGMDADRRAGVRPVSPQTAFMTGEREIREAMALTAGMIAMIDDAVGALTATLARLGLEDSTVVCFTADHGDYLGDFDMLLKGALPFRSITRTPFVWSEPQDRRSGRAAVSNALLSTIDIPAAILDRAGVRPYFGMQGQSFLDCLAGGGGPREELLVEYNDNGARLGFASPARMRSIVDDRFRFTIYAGLPWGELYDLEQDPDETTNLWDDPARAGDKAALSLRLNHLLAGLMDESPRPARRA